MKHAIILLAHKGYDYIDNFLSQFENDLDFYFFIHLDTKIKWDENKVNDLKNKYTNIIYFDSKINGVYCTFNLVEAELLCINEAYKFGCDYYHTMSECDFIISSISYFKKYFDVNKDKEFLFHRNWEEGTTCYKDIDSVVNKDFNHIYNGTQWWSLTHKCIGLILEKDKIYNEYYKNYKGYLMAFDEVYFQNIILADLKNENLQIVNKSLRYVDWIDLEDPKLTHPNWLIYSRKYKYVLEDNLIIRKIDYKNEDSQKYLKYTRKHFIEFKDCIHKKVLICMCVRNRAEIMLNSIKSLFEQSYKNIELLFIDDASEDNTLNTLVNIKRTFWDNESNNYTVKNLQCKTWASLINILVLDKHDFIRARNQMFNCIGVDVKNYDYIAILDSDDLYKQDKIEQQLRYFEEHPELDVVSSLIMFDKNTKLRYTTKDLLHDDIKKLIEGGENMAQICHFPSIMFKSKCLNIFKNKVYFYPECENGGEDQLFLYTLFNAGFKFGNCSKAVYLYNYCRYTDSISANIGKHTNKDNFIFKNFFNKGYKDKIELVNTLFNKYNG